MALENIGFCAAFQSERTVDAGIIKILPCIYLFKTLLKRWRSYLSSAVRISLRYE